MYYKKGGIKEDKPIFVTITDGGITFNRKRSKSIKETKRTLTLAHNRPVTISHFSNEEKLALVDLLLKQ